MLQYMQMVGSYRIEKHAKIYVSFRSQNESLMYAVHLCYLQVLGSTVHQSTLLYQLSYPNKYVLSINVTFR